MSLLQDIMVGVVWLALWSIEAILRVFDSDNTWPTSRKRTTRHSYQGT